MYLIKDILLNLNNAFEIVLILRNRYKTRDL
jgi:hypothetical protein